MKKISTLSLPVFTAVMLICTAAYAQNNLHRIQAQDKNLTGMTAGGGKHGYGVAYQFNTQTGKDTVPVNTIEYQASGTAYGMPKGSTLLLANNGLLYGMSQFGGLFGMGCIFCINPATGKDSVVGNFTWANGYGPVGPLMQASNGLIYGMAPMGGTAADGVLFYYNPVTGQDSVMVNFKGSNGSNPNYCKLVQASNGLLYGMTESGGTYNYGVLFSFDPVAKTETVIQNFNDSNGKNPYGGLVLATDGKLYGLCTNGGGIGNHDSGVIFSYSPSNLTFSTLYYFRNKSGAMPFGSLMQAGNGLLYGDCGFGGQYGLGTMFCFNYNTLKDSVLIQFNAFNGSLPNGDDGLIQATDGMLYGTTSTGGDILYPYGVLYRYNPVTGNDSVVENFTNGNAGGQPGELPLAGVTEVPATGKLYGLTMKGGTFASGGTSYSYNIGAKAYSQLANLGGTSSNEGCLMEATNGMLYGVTGYGGNYSSGTLFKLDPTNNSVSILHHFNDTDGLAPYGMLCQANNGLLYGTASHGDTNPNTWGEFFGPGVLYSFNPTNNQFQYLHNFGEGSLSGVYPYGSLMQASNNKLYGTTLMGGAGGFGTLYFYNPAGNTDSVAVSFSGLNGAYPIGSVIQASNQLLYGMTMLGGTGLTGVLYSYNIANGKDSVMFNFTGPNGSFPFGDLMQSTADNNIYGMTTKGGTGNDGVIFRFNPVTGQDTVVLNFSGANGAHPYKSLIQDSAGILYGTTRYGGTHGTGVLFSFNTVTKTQTILLNFSADSGEYPCNLLFVHGATQAVHNVLQPENIILVYPNPFHTAATVVFGENGAHRIDINDMNGKQTGSVETSGKQCEIPRGNLAPGMYFLKIYNGQGIYESTSKIIIQ